VPGSGHLPDPSGPDLAEIGRALRVLREESELSVADLAAAAATSVDRIEAVEEGRDPLRFGLFCRLADALGVGLSEVTQRASSWR
jgi:transcriptional regulator with XRE-family HTH domain